MVSSRAKISDVLLRKRGCLGTGMLAAAGSVAEHPPRHTPSSSDSGNPLQVTNQETIVQQLLTERWAASDTEMAIRLLKTRGKVVTLSECRLYL